MNASADWEAVQHRGGMARLSLRAKLLIGFVAIALLMAVGATVSLLGMNRSLNAVDRLLDADARIAYLSLWSTTSMLKARRHEKDFLLSHAELGFGEAKSRYATPVRIHTADIRDHMAEIRQLTGDAEMVQHTRQIEQAIGQYETGFLRVVELYGQLGRVDTGLEGRFQVKAYDIEMIVNRHGVQRLAIGLLTLRRLEKDYLLRGRERNAAALREAVADFRGEAARAPLPPAVREQLQALAAEYLASFEQYLEVGSEAERATEIYLRAVRTVEPLLAKLHLSALAAADATRDSVHNVALVSRRATLAVAVLAPMTGLLVGFLVFRNISRTVRACVSFARSLAQGTLDLRLAPGGHDEFADLATALNVMADDLAESRRALEQRADELAEANRSLQNEVVERKQSQEEISRLNQELEARIRTGAILNEFTSVLQSCQSTAEASSAIARFSQKLFPGRSGAVYLMHNSRNYLESVTAWGDPILREEQLDPGSCWALRRGEVHQVDDPATEVVCPHQQALGRPVPPYLCVPMTAQSDTFGLVYLEYSDPERHIPWKIPAGDKSLAASLVRESALALANIKLQETLRNRSVRDSLTGLFNRRFLEEALARELARCQRNPAPLGVIMLDVDHFKRFNDAHGHDAGDLVLRELGGMLTEESRGATSPAGLAARSSPCCCRIRRSRRRLKWPNG